MKKLTNYIVDLGRVVAFYPGLRKITDNSIPASILLCQLIYWTDKTRNGDGWIWKDSSEIEEETGLTYYEQKTARKILRSHNFIKEINKRLHHKIYFKVNQEEVNKAWENFTHNRVEEPKVEKSGLLEGTQPPLFELPKEEKPKQEVKEKESEKYPTYEIEQKMIIDGKEVTRTRRTAVKPQGDIVDGILKYGLSPEARREAEMKLMKEKIESRLKINVVLNAKWMSFLRFAYERQTKHGESLDTFLSWILQQPDYNAVYWSPQRMKTFYPQAFLEWEKIKPREDFVEKMPEYVEPTDIVPMPDYVKKKNIPVN